MGVMPEQYEPVEDYYTVTQLSAKWRVTERAVQKWIKAGTFPNAYKVGLGRGSHFRVPVSDVMEFERKRKVRHDNSN